MRYSLIIVLLVSLVACAPRGVIGFAHKYSGAKIQPVFVVSERQTVKVGTEQIFEQSFGEQRSSELHYSQFDISIPPVHKTGIIEWPYSEPPDASKHFVVTDSARYNNIKSMLHALDRRNGGHVGEVMVFVHGYNNNNAEATYRLAQIAHDFDVDWPVISFSWPSAGDARGYAYDRDSVIFSRDGLEKTLTALTEHGDRKVILMAHSMGSQLVMETLRQMAIGNKRKQLAQISGVALISPDIDEDVFKRQAERIKPMPQPFLLLVSAKDRILNLSAFITGRTERLGSIQNRDVLQGLPVTVVDLTDTPDGGGIEHTKAFTSPQAIELLKQRNDLQRASN